MYYKPSIKSLFGSLVWDFSIAFMAAIITFFGYKAHPRIIVALDIIAGLVVLVMLLQTINVYCTKIYIDDHCIMTSSPLCTTRIQWGEVTGTLLRERKNAMSRTDHLLILKSRDGNIILYNTSTLSPQDEEAVLAKVRSMVRLDVKEDRPAM